MADKNTASLILTKHEKADGTSDFSYEVDVTDDSTWTYQEFFPAALQALREMVVEAKRNHESR